ncbi:MAG: hypothetical protein GX624_07260 [Actinobacteria bacterium]|nr:hypothetical protein [Actinomycetota bacterium]
MRLRVLVVAAFVMMTLAPAYIAYDAGILPSPTEAVADVGDRATSVTFVTELAWPKDPLGLAASDAAVFWEQRDRSAAVAGLWSYDVLEGRVERLLGRSRTGKSDGFPAAAGDMVVWAAWSVRRGEGLQRIEGYDTVTTRRWTAAASGRQPAAAGRTVIWIDRDRTRAGDVIRGLNTLTDEEYAIQTRARVRQIAARGSWVAWLEGDGTKTEVWTGSLRGGNVVRLAPAGTAVAVDGGRVMWAVPAGDGSSDLLISERRADAPRHLHRVAGAVSSLVLSGDHAAWVTTSDASASAVWVYDLATGEAYPVDDTGGRQVSPVIAAGSVYWAGERGGAWGLYRRALR